MVSDVAMIPGETAAEVVKNNGWKVEGGCVVL